MNILIGADFVPTESNTAYFVRGDAQHLFGEELQKLLAAADYRIFNLETPLTDTATPIPKCGPNLIASTGAVAGYRAAGADLLTLANNHILDQGEAGLRTTVETLERAGIAHIGAGDTPHAAAEPYIFTCSGRKIGVYACAEHEFSIVSDTTAGANPIDLLETPDHIAALKAQCDFVIVLYHGGKEYYRYPSPELQKICRKLTEKGADLVLCQHTHCIGCAETHAGGTIVYGQGNFLFDGSEHVCWQTGLLVRIGDDFAVSYIPLVKQGETVRLAEGEAAEKILADFSVRSAEILQDGFVAQHYAAFAGEMLEDYLRRACAHRMRLPLRICNKLSGYRLVPWLLKRRYGGVRMRVLENCLACEAHRELFLEGVRHR